MKTTTTTADDDRPEVGDDRRDVDVRVQEPAVVGRVQPDAVDCERDQRGVDRGQAAASRTPPAPARRESAAAGARSPPVRARPAPARSASGASLERWRRPSSAPADRPHSPSPHDRRLDGARRFVNRFARGSPLLVMRNRRRSLRSPCCWPSPAAPAPRPAHPHRSAPAAPRPPPRQPRPPSRPARSRRSSTARTPPAGCRCSTRSGSSRTACWSRARIPRDGAAARAGSSPTRTTATSCLRVRYRITPGGNSGIFLRDPVPRATRLAAADGGQGPWESGYEVNINNDEPVYPTGSVWDAAKGPGKLQRENEWNDVLDQDPGPADLDLGQRRGRARRRGAAGAIRARRDRLSAPRDAAVPRQGDRGEVGRDPRAVI